MQQTAVVLGASVAGLLAAAALAPRYHSVEVIERDVLPAGPHPRRGAPQGHHVHALLPRGLQAVEELLPGFTDRLVAAGAHRGDVLGNARWYLNGRLLRRHATGLTAVSASRALIEDTIRTMVRSLPYVHITDGHDIVGLTPAGPAPAGRARVGGVQITDRNGGGSRIIPAGLVVDATGRGSRMPRWLTGLGYAPPDEDTVGIDLRYASRMFAGDGLLGDDLAVVTARHPGQRRSAVVQRLEGGRVLVTLAGVHGERPPTELPAFADYAATLSAADTAAIIDAGTPVGAATTFHFPAYQRRRYDNADLPRGILVLGDAACAFNPVYAQGMSVAAMAAATLRDDDDPERFHARQAQLQEAPWTLAVGADLALDAPPTPPPSATTSDLVHRLQLAAAEDGELAAAFIRVTSLVDPPQALGAPWIVERLTGRAVTNPAPSH